LTAGAFAQTLEAVLRLESNDHAQEGRFVDAMVIEQGRIGAGDRRHLHLAEAQLGPCQKRCHG